MSRIEGMIVGASGGLYEIECGSGERVFCRAKGVFRHEDLTPVVGDRVTLSDEGGAYIIESVKERSSLLIRPPLANLGLLFVVIPSARPAPDLYTADKLTAIAVNNNITPVIIVSKCSLDRSGADRIANIYRGVFDIFVTDAVERIGLEELGAFIKAKCKGIISAFAGASGAGKSTLMNALFPELSQDTGEVSRKTGRGRHTTRKVELFETECRAMIADTPGFTMLDFERFDFFTLRELPLAFPEIERVLGECRYSKCTHRKEEGCAVLREIREGRMDHSRHESYLALYEILKNKHEWDKKD